MRTLRGRLPPIGFCAVLLWSCARADIYLHGALRGSNNRNCRNDNNDERRNANRLFDSQNNADGGYSCPRRYPFPPGSNQQGSTDPYGRLSGAGSLDTDTFWVYATSEIQLEWTNQHGAGRNSNVDADVIWQYMTDDHDPAATPDDFLGNRYLRDGTPTRNNDNNDDTNDEATTRIGGDGNGNNAFNALNQNDVNDGRYGYHEPIRNYELCAKTERNGGLFLADQSLEGNKKNARYTRQDNNGNRYGFECPEERDYYPYWRPSPWHDITILTSNVSHCEDMQAPFSQNVVEKCQCYDSSASEDNPASISEGSCSGTWSCLPAWKDQPKKCGWAGSTWTCDRQPECILAAYSRDNHLGNQLTPEQSREAMSDGPSDKTVQPASYVWQVPEFLKETKVVLRLRYNITTTDYERDRTDASSNGDASPIVDRNTREELSYVDVGLAEGDSATERSRYKLSITTNSDQFGRTFQDRTYVFIVKPLPVSLGTCRNRIKSLSTRGKRGNIVQAYPSVEYDFVPQSLTLEHDECLHIHWIGSDYNPNRNPNNGMGGPPNPNNDNEAKADRFNLVQLQKSGMNTPYHLDDIEAQGDCFFHDGSKTRCDRDQYRKMALLDQDMSACMTVAQLKSAGVNNQDDRERDVRNCGKINGGSTAASSPFFDGGIIKPKPGTYKFASTRNNNFSNRSQKLLIHVKGSGGLSSAEVAGIVLGTLTASTAAGVVFVSLNKRRKSSLSRRSASKQAGGFPSELVVSSNINDSNNNDDDNNNNNLKTFALTVPADQSAGPKSPMRVIM